MPFYFCTICADAMVWNALPSPEIGSSRPLDPDPRAMLVFDIAQTIETALSGPVEIGVLEVAEMILAKIEESPRFRIRARVSDPAKSRLMHAG